MLMTILTGAEICRSDVVLSWHRWCSHHCAISPADRYAGRCADGDCRVSSTVFHIHWFNI